MRPDTTSQTRTSFLRRLADAADQQAWRDFVERYGSRIFRWCRSAGLQEADAEDVTQDLLAKLAVQMRTFEYDPTKSFRAWLKTVTKNAVINSLNKKKRFHQLLEVAAEKALLQELEPQFEHELLDEAMSRAQTRVKPSTWDAFRLTAIENLATDEAAQTLQLGEGTVRVYRSRVEKCIREELERLQVDEPD